MNSQPVNAKQAKTLRAKVLAQFPKLEEHIESFWPKKAAVMTLKLKGETFTYTTFIKVGEQIAFIEMRDKPIIPMLRLLHQYPDMMDKMQCDKGAIRHIFSGSNIMAPGLTSEGGIVAEHLEIGAPVAIMAEGKSHAMGIGFLKQSSTEIREKSKGMAIDLIQYLNDQLWKEIKFS